MCTTLECDEPGGDPGGTCGEFVFSTVRVGGCCELDHHDLDHDLDHADHTLIRYLPHRRDLRGVFFYIGEGVL